MEFHFETVEVVGLEFLSRESVLQRSLDYRRNVGVLVPHPQCADA